MLVGIAVGTNVGDGVRVGVGGGVADGIADDVALGVVVIGSTVMPRANTAPSEAKLPRTCAIACSVGVPEMVVLAVRMTARPPITQRSWASSSICPSSAIGVAVGVAVEALVGIAVGCGRAMLISVRAVANAPALNTSASTIVIASAARRFQGCISDPR